MAHWTCLISMEDPPHMVGGRGGCGGGAEGGVGRNGKGTRGRRGGAIFLVQIPDLASVIRCPFLRVAITTDHQIIYDK